MEEKGHQGRPHDVVNDLCCEAANRRDGLSRCELLMRVADAGDGLAARIAAAP